MSDSFSSNRVERRQRRRQERRVFLSLSSLFAIGLVFGLAGALYIAWVGAPLDETTGSPAVFRQDFKEDYIYMVSQGYAADGDWARARARLDLLQDEVLPQTVVALLEEFLRSGRPAAEVRNLARLAEQLGGEGTALALFAPTPLAGGGVALLPTATPTGAAAPQPTPTLLPTPTRPPAAATDPTRPPAGGSAPPPTATPPPAYRLLSQEQLCQADLAAARIEVVVVDANLVELPGVEIVVRWDGGEDRFLTGFKLGESAGYGDFTMAAGISYQVSLADGSGLVGGLQAGRCEDDSGPAGWALEYQYVGE